MLWAWRSRILHREPPRCAPGSRTPGAHGAWTIVRAPARPFPGARRPALFAPGCKLPSRHRSCRHRPSHGVSTNSSAGSEPPSRLGPHRPVRVTAKYQADYRASSRRGPGHAARGAAGRAPGGSGGARPAGRARGRAPPGLRPARFSGEKLSMRAAPRTFEEPHPRRRPWVGDVARIGRGPAPDRPRADARVATRAG